VPLSWEVSSPEFSTNGSTREPLPPLRTPRILNMRTWSTTDELVNILNSNKIEDIINVEDIFNKAFLNNFQSSKPYN